MIILSGIHNLSNTFKITLVIPKIITKTIKIITSQYYIDRIISKKYTLTNNKFLIQFLKVNSDTSLLNSETAHTFNQNWKLYTPIFESKGKWDNLG